MANNYYGVSNGITLSICAQSQGSERSMMAAEAGSRFFQIASMLPCDKSLQFQLRFGNENDETKAYAFSNEAGLTRKDYDWIFCSCCDAGSGSLSGDEVRLENRNVYKIVPCPWEEPGNGQAMPLRPESWGMIDDYDYENFPCDYYRSFLEMLSELCGDMRIISNGDHSELWIALPDEMPFRMRALLTFIFPHTEVKLIDIYESSLEEKPVADQIVLKKALKYALVFLMDKKDGKGFHGLNDSWDPDEKELIDTFGTDCLSPDRFGADDLSSEDVAGDIPSDPYSTPIDELELSIRSYNCLMRAGITTVGKLMETSDEELRHIRNLGRRSFTEIKQRLSEYKARSCNAKAPELKGKDYQAMLDEMIGLGDVKEQVRKIAAFARMKKDLDAKGSAGVPVVFNMEFVGNPGTAKTTVARILAGILNEIGILSSNELIEVGRSDLVGKYVGQTAGKVKDVFQRAKGKLLFIDEAYSLVECWEDSYGDEAIDTIVQEMENNREDTIVIFAGYPKEMADFFSRNPGLRSRVPFHIEFKDYSADELVQIAGLEAKKRGFEISQDTVEQLLNICEKAAGRPECGNGRFCRNLIENAILNYAVRCYSADGMRDDAACDVKDCVLKCEDLTVTDHFGKESSWGNENLIGFRV